MPSRRSDSVRLKQRAQFVELAAGLRRRRLKKGLTQMEVARALDVGTGMLRSWELGESVPSAVNFIAWVNALDLWVELTGE